MLQFCFAQPEMTVLCRDARGAELGDDHLGAARVVHNLAVERGVEVKTGTSHREPRQEVYLDPVKVAALAGAAPTATPIPFTINN